MSFVVVVVVVWGKKNKNKKCLKTLAVGKKKYVFIL